MSSKPAIAPAGHHSETNPAALHADIVKHAGFLDRMVIWLLALFTFILPTDLRYSNDKSIAMRIGYACLLFGILGVMKRRTAIVPSLGFCSLTGFVVWSAFTLTWAEYPGAAQHKILVYLALFAVTAIIPQYAWNVRYRAVLMDAYVYGCWLGVIGTAVNFSIGTEYTVDGVGAMEGRYSFGTDPNYLALALVIGIPLAIYRLGQTLTSWRRVPHLLYPPAAIAGVVFTGSRGAVMALLAALLVYVFLTSWKTRVFLVGSAAVFLLTIWLSPSAISDRFSTIPGELNNGTLSDRRDLWDRGRMVAREHPIEGIGAGATTGKLEIAAHNTPLELMMEGGAVSLVLFYTALLLGIIRLWKTDRREGGAVAALCASWLVGTCSLSWEANTVSWFIFAMLFSAGSPQTVDAPTPSANTYRAESA